MQAAAICIQSAHVADCRIAHPGESGAPPTYLPTYRVYSHPASTHPVLPPTGPELQPSASRPKSSKLPIGRHTCLPGFHGNTSCVCMCAHAQLQSLTYYLHQGTSFSTRLSTLMPSLASATLRDFPGLTDPSPLAGCRGWEQLLDAAEQPARTCVEQGCRGRAPQRVQGDMGTVLHPGSVASRGLPDVAPAMASKLGTSYQVGCTPGRCRIVVEVRLRREGTSALTPALLRSYSLGFKACDLWRGSPLLSAGPDTPDPHQPLILTHGSARECEQPACHPPHGCSCPPEVPQGR
jgi:hypothetical protein